MFFIFIYLFICYICDLWSPSKNLVNFKNVTDRLNQSPENMEVYDISTSLGLKIETKVLKFPEMSIYK